MKTSRNKPAFLLLVVLAAAVGWKRAGMDEALGIAPASALRVNAEPAAGGGESAMSVPSMAPTAALERIAVHPTGFLASGEVLIHGADAEVVGEALTLVWSNGEESSCDPLGETWQMEFGASTYTLASVSSLSGRLAIVAPVEVSPDSPRCRLELIAPGKILIDVRDGSKDGARLKSASFSSTPSGTGYVTPEIPIQRARDTSPHGAIGNMVGWSMPHSLVPLLVPPTPRGWGITVEAPGYQKQILNNIQEPGLYVVPLVRQRTLFLQVDSDFGDIGEYNLSIAIEGCAVPKFHKATRAPKEIAIDITSCTSVIVDVSRPTSLGLSPRVGSHKIQLSGSGDMYASIDLSVRGEFPAPGSLLLTVALPGATGDFEKWELSLVPSDLAVLDVAVRRLPSSRLRTWEIGTDGKRAHRLFINIEPGAYDAVLEPGGIRVPVEITSGKQVDAKIVVPSAVRVKVWPIDAQGDTCERALSMGTLAWKIYDEGAQAREVSDPAYANEVSGRIVAADFMLSYVQHAKQVGGAWVISAPLGKPILIQFMGPAVLQAQVVTVSAPTGGPSDVSMQFHGL